MNAHATESSCQVISFPSPVDGQNKDNEMKKFRPKYENNIAIQAINKTEYKIHVRVKSEQKPVKRVEIFYGSKTDAKRRAKKFVEEVRDELETIKSPRSLTFFKTFGECVDFYSKYKNMGKKDITYINQLSNEFHDTPLEDLSMCLDEFILLKQTQVTKYGKPYSNGTLNHYRKWTRAIINFCIEKKRLSHKYNYLEKQEMLTEVPRTRIIKDSEVNRLLEAIDEIAPHLYPALMFSLQIPIRRSAIENMRQSWIDENRITIPAKFTKHKKGDDNIPIPPNMVEYFKTLPRYEYVFFKDMGKGRLRKLSDNDFSRLWRRVKERAGIDDLRWHDNRHHAATKLLLAGISERVVMQVGGWKTNMFNTYYNHSSLLACDEVYQHLTNE